MILNVLRNASSSIITTNGPGHSILDGLLCSLVSKDTSFLNRFQKFVDLSRCSCLDYCFLCMSTGCCDDLVGVNFPLLKVVGEFLVDLWSTKQNVQQSVDFPMDETLIAKQRSLVPKHLDYLQVLDICSKKRMRENPTSLTQNLSKNSMKHYLHKECFQTLLTATSTITEKGDTVF